MEKSENQAISTSSIAGFWRRLGAFFIDALLLGIVGYCFGLAFFDFLASLGGWARLIGFSVSIIYFGVSDSVIFNGQSLGKRVLKIKVLSVNGASLSLPQSSVRAAIFCVPYFLNGAMINFIALPSVLSWFVMFLIFGVGGSIQYLLIFNRKTRQSIHDLAVNSYVVRTVASEGQDAYKQALPARIWRGHVTVTTIILVIAACAPIVTSYVTNREPFISLIPLQKKIMELPEVRAVSLFSGASVSASSENGTQTQSYLTIRAIITTQEIDPDALADRMVQIVLNGFPDIKSKNFISVSLEYGFDIGIASHWQRKNVTRSVSDWGQRSKMTDEQARALRAEAAKGDATALATLINSANNGAAVAQYHLGRMSERGQALPVDYVVAASWYQKAANQGYAPAENNLGAIYERGDGVAENDSLALELYKKSANQNFAIADYNVASIYSDGRGVPRDQAEAMRWYAKAGKDGNSDGWYAIGDIFYNGYGVEQNYAEALKYYQLAASSGNESATTALGVMSQLGQGVPVDFDKARNLFLRATNSGDSYASLNLAGMYRDGQGIPADQKVAADWMEKSANEGNGEAQFQIGMIYLLGTGVPKNVTTATNWFLLAASQDLPGADYQIGRIFELGVEAPTDFDAAMNAFIIAADHGFPPALMEIGVMYDLGHGVNKDPIEAYKWMTLSKASANQNTSEYRIAANKLTLANARLTKADIENAMNGARIWAAQHPDLNLKL